MDTGKNLIVTLRAYRGEVNYDANGKVKSENQPVKLTYGSGAWDNYMNHAKLNHTSITVEKVVEETLTNIDTGRKNAQGFKITRPEFSYKDMEISEEIKEAVKGSMSIAKKALTPDQIRLEELEAIVANLSTQDRGKTHKPSKPKKTVEAPDETPEVNEELEAAKARYTELYHKEPHHMAQLKGINEKIAKREKELESE